MGRLPTREEDEIWTPHGDGYNDVSELAIEVRPRDANGRHLVAASQGSTTHKHRFDVDNQRDRRAFREAVISRFGLGEDSHEWLEERIVMGAEAADSNDSLIECSTVRLCDVQPEQVEWLWRERIAIGKLTLIVGDPGQGKSFLTLDIAARVSRGAAWPDSLTIMQPAGDVILLTAEDDLADTIRPRLDALEADVSRIVAIRGAKFVDEENERMVNLSTDLHSIRRVVRSANKPRAIVIDPVSAYLGRTDSHNNAEVRGVLAPLAELAAETRIAVIAVSHLRKGEGAAMYRTMGSLAFIAAARSAWVVARDEADHSRRLLLPIKSNIAPDVGGLAFAIKPYGPDNAPVVCWEAEPVSVAADDAIGHGQRHRGRPASEGTEAADWLREHLAGGPKPAKEVIDEADGYGFTKRTMQKALRDIGGKSEKRGFSNGWLWSLGDQQHKGEPKAHEDTATDIYAPSGDLCAFGETPKKTTTNSLFLRNGSAKAHEIGSGAPSDPFDDFERERIELSNGHDSPWF